MEYFPRSTVLSERSEGIGRLCFICNEVFAAQQEVSLLLIISADDIPDDSYDGDEISAPMDSVVTSPVAHTKCACHQMMILKRAYN